MRPEYGVAGLWISQLRPSCPAGSGCAPSRFAFADGYRAILKRRRWTRFNSDERARCSSAGYSRSTSEIAFEPEKIGASAISSSGGRCCGYDLRWTTNPYASHDRTARQRCCRRRYDNDAATQIADRLAHHFCRGVVASVGRFGANGNARRGKAGQLAACATICTLNGTNRKPLCGTKACDESSITAACYLCNTLPKTAGLARFPAVPLLCVQKSSVIVMLRRRGASRGRPVLGGSLKSLAFLRECPKARSG
jgi:hypothetical protein